MSAWRFGGKGREESCGSAFGVLRRADIKIGRRVEGAGCRVRAEKAVGKSVVWREAWKREVRRVVVWSISEEVGLS